MHMANEKKAADAVVQIRGPSMVGTGFYCQDAAFGADPVIMTNAHVIGNEAVCNSSQALFFYDDTSATSFAVRLRWLGATTLDASTLDASALDALLVDPRRPEAQQRRTN